MAKPKHRKNVAAVVLNSEGLILSCHRSDISGIWQLPQGGVDAGEAEEEALLRELEEEIGTKEINIIGKLSKIIRYDWPVELHRRGFCGQDQRYFLVRLKDGANIKLDHQNHKAEFNQFEWVTGSQFLARVSGFKRAPYVEALEALMSEYPNLIKWA